MDTVISFLRTNWQWVIIGLGGLLLLGGIFNWSWATDMTGNSRVRGMESGSGCARIFVGIIGLVLVVGGIVSFFF